AMIERRSVMVVAFLRLVPVFPVNLLNYGLGSSSMKFRVYFVASLILSIPGAAMYAWLGEAANQVWRTGHVSWSAVSVIASLAAASLALLFFARRRFASLRAGGG